MAGLPAPRASCNAAFQPGPRRDRLGFVGRSLPASPGAGAVPPWPPARGCCSAAAPAPLLAPLPKNCPTASSWAHPEQTLQGCREERAFPRLGAGKTLKSAFISPNSRVLSYSKMLLALLQLTGLVPRREGRSSWTGKRSVLSSADFSSPHGCRAGKVSS